MLLAGDTSVTVWRDYIIPENINTLKSTILFVSHHGSFSFFNENKDTDEDYIGRLAEIKPTATIISVGATNPHGHPNESALLYYENYSSGADNGQKIFRTDQHGNMKLELRGQGAWWINWNQV